MDDSGVNIRRASADDVEELARLRLDLLREVGNLKQEKKSEALAEVTRHFLRETLSDGRFLCWVAEADGQIVGISGLMLFETPPDAGNYSGLEAYVMNMYTVPHWRHKGIATALLRRAIDFVKTTSTRRIWLRATGQRGAIYERAGFVSSAGYMELVW